MSRPRDIVVSQEKGIAWLAAGSPGKAPTKNCRHSSVERDEGVARKLQKTHRQAQCPHCGLWSLWVLK